MQGRFNHEALDRRQTEAIFREHLGSLQKRVVDGYITLLEEVECHAQPEHPIFVCISVFCLQCVALYVSTCPAVLPCKFPSMRPTHVVGNLTLPTGSASFTMFCIPGILFVASSPRDPYSQQWDDACRSFGLYCPVRSRRAMNLMDRPL